jgi:hypothetical protein
MKKRSEVTKKYWKNQEINVNQVIWSCNMEYLPGCNFWNYLLKLFFYSTVFKKKKKKNNLD